MRNMKSQQGKVRKKAEQSCVQYLAAKSSCDLHFALFSCNLLYLSLCYPKTSISLDRSCKQLTEHTANKGLSSSQYSSFVQLSRQLQGLGLICAGVVLEIKIIQLRMAEQGDIGCTSLDFLSKLQVSPKKKRVFCKLSLNTDLEQINQVLKSPVARVQKIAIPTVLDIDKTKTFVMSLLQKYEKVEEIEKKWEGFMLSVNSPLEFQKYVGSLKEIAGNQLCRTNPENGEEAEQGKKPGQRKRAAARAASVRRVENKEKAKEGKVSSGKLRELLKQEIYQLKDLLLAGEKFIHSQ